MYYVVSPEKREEMRRARRRQEAFRKFLKGLLKFTGITVGVVAAVLLFFYIWLNTEYRYGIRPEHSSNYIMVTEKHCKVYEVTDTKVTVEYKGELYSFYAYNSELKVGDKIWCRFTDNMQIYDIIE